MRPASRILILLALHSAVASAAAPSSWLRAVPGTGSLEVGTETAGVNAQHEGWAGELHFAWQDFYLDARLGKRFSLLDAGVFGLDAQAGASLITTTWGPFDAGLGLHGAITARLAFYWVHAVLGVQVGAEGFARGLVVRAPTRLLLGLGLTLPGLGGRLRLGAGARAGADFAPSHAPTARAEGMIWLELNSLLAPETNERMEGGAEAPSVTSR